MHLLVKDNKKDNLEVLGLTQDYLPLEVSARNKSAEKDDILPSYGL